MITPNQIPFPKRVGSGNNDAPDMKNKQVNKDKDGPQYENMVIEESSSALMIGEEHIYGNQELVGRPLTVDELASYIKEMSKSKDPFKEEFEVGSTPISVANQSKK